MPDIRIKNQNRLESVIKRSIKERMKRVFSQGESLMLGQAQILRREFENSAEFKDLKGRLIGEFGFTPEEVQKIDRLLTLLVPGGNEITVTKIQNGPNRFLMQLDWVDFEELKAHEFALHLLTKLDADGKVESITDIISWVEWLEEGATVRGYEFFRPGTGLIGGARGTPAVNFSRSGEGLMRRRNSGFWTFEPTRVFERIALAEKGDFFKKGFGILLSRSANG
ncbi:MAG: hypothetical protein ACXADW_08655 [Candidatus Hodarchaeales archaeon]|jgi:hypothetical protein